VSFWAKVRLGAKIIIIIIIIITINKPWRCVDPLHCQTHGLADL
jgi:hypothetical protein